MPDCNHSREYGPVGFRRPGVQYSLPFAYTERLAERLASWSLSVGSLGDSYDNALAESILGLFEDGGHSP